MKPPAFQFYADDFLAGTADMTNEEVGAYIRLLCHQWSKGCIPGDMDRVSRMAGAMPVPSLGYILSKFQRGEDGNFRNARMEAERKKQDEYRLKQAEKGKVGADKRWNHSTGHAPAIADAIAPAMPVPQPKDGSPSPSPSPVSSLQSPPPKVTRVPKLHVGGGGGRFAPPSQEEVALQCAKIGLPESEAEGFLAYYESNGWRVGRNPMRSWVGALTTWKKNWIERNGHARNGTSRPHGPAQSELQPNLAARLAKLDAGGDEWPAKPGASPNPVG